MLDIADFVAHAPVERDVIEAYRGRVPDDLVEVWEKYGYGTFGEGFLRIINPAVYEVEVGECIGKTQGDGVAIPVMVTGFGDLITWEPSHNALIAILLRKEDTSGLGTVTTFFNLTTRGGPKFLSRSLHWDIFPEAVAAHGELPFDESFIYVPLLSLGGRSKVENLHKRQTLTAIQLMVDFQGVVGH